MTFFTPSLIATDKTLSTPTAKEIISKMKMKAGPGISKPVIDGYTGKSYETVDDLLAHYGYAAVK